MKTAGMDHEMMLVRIASNAIVANDDSIPADVVGTCARGARKHKCGELALKQQESMSPRFWLSANTSQNGSRIIERDGAAVRGRRREIQCLKPAFPGLGEWQCLR